MMALPMVVVTFRDPPWIIVISVEIAFCAAFWALIGYGVWAVLP